MIISQNIVNKKISGKKFLEKHLLKIYPYPLEKTYIEKHLFRQSFLKCPNFPEKFDGKDSPPCLRGGMGRVNGGSVT
jgi:hypothetical protein